MLVRCQGAYETGRRPFEDVSGSRTKINVLLPQPKLTSELSAYVEICKNVHPKCL